LIHAIPDPFDLTNSAAYLAWRARKLRAWARGAEELRANVAHLGTPGPAELTAIGALIAKFNLALIACRDPPQLDATTLLAFGRRLGLVRLATNLCADERAVSAVAVRPTGRASEYVPHTDRPLSWHTDGYDRTPESEVRAWMLFCVRDAAAGGENTLLDPEIAYIQLRDEDASLIRALMEPDAMTVPANVRGGMQLFARRAQDPSFR
jgi:alpha-ketoglutarate-dependent taurine dioxygenase